MKKITLLINLSLLTFIGNAQNAYLDSLTKALAQAQSDTSKLYTISYITSFYTYSQPDSAMMYAQQEISLAREMKSDKALSAALRDYAGVFSVTGNYPQAIYFELESLKLAEKVNDFVSIAWCYSWLTSTYTDAADYTHALFYTRKEHLLLESLAKSSPANKKTDWYDGLYNDAMFGVTNIYNKLHQPDSALKYLQIANINERNNPAFNLFANVYFEKGDYGQAISYYRKGYWFATGHNVYTDVLASCNGLAKTFWKMNLSDSSILYAKKAIEINKYAKYTLGELEALGLLAEIFKSNGDNDSTVKYLQLSLYTKDSLFNQRKIMQMQSMTFSEQLRQQDIADAQKIFRDKVKTYFFIGGLIVLLLVAFILFRSNMQTKKANIKIEKAYSELKSAQARLIQSEKMASLGELTAGIAHEIQNPLNFVNNFSEVNKEMIDEASVELSNGNIGEVKNILNDIRDNSEKINHHGKRADAIVKGMLQHSRHSAGKPELTDINALCEECLRLSYHGLLAKDSAISSDFPIASATNLDSSLEKIKIVPQDIGKALLNLLNNAFYAVNEKQKIDKVSAKSYSPLVSLQTKKVNGKIEITVSDNGGGIPPAIIDKIFQPFFTTKPTGQGTGLGLSLAYDIITKEHAGVLKVESKEGEGTSFVIKLSAT